MDSLPYVDTLFKEYLLFRGFTATLQSFGADLAADRCCGFQAEALCELIFGQLLPQCRTAQMMELLELLADRLYSQLDGRFEALVERMEVALIKAALVMCVRSGRQEKVAEFFRQHGNSLLSGPEAGVWRQWAALAFVPTPRKDPVFQAYFSQEWMSLLEVSFRNFLSQVMASLPLPAVLRFNADRRQRLALQQQVEALQRQLEAMSQQLAAAQAAAEARQQQEDAIGKGIMDSKEAEAAKTPLLVHPLPTDAASSETGVESSIRIAPGSRDVVGNGRAGVMGSPAQAPEARNETLGQSKHTAAQPPPPSPPPPPPRPPSPPSPARQQLSPQSQLSPQPHPHHHYHHGRTLSLEAWHAVVDAEDNAEVPPLTVRDEENQSVGRSRSTVVAATSFEGFTSGLRGEATPLDAAAGGEVRGTEPPLVSTPLAVPSSTAQRTVVNLPPLSEEIAEPAPKPLGSGSPLLSSSVAIAAGALSMTATMATLAGLPPMREPLEVPPHEGEGDAEADGDRDVDEDPAVMLVLGPTVDGGGDGSGTAVRGRPSASSMSTSASDGDHHGSVGDDDGGTATATVDGEDYNDNVDDHDSDVEGERGQRQTEGATEGEEEGCDTSSSYGARRRAAGSVGDADVAGVYVITAAIGTSGSSSCSSASRVERPQSVYSTRASGGGTAGAAVVGGGRWQGISTHLAAAGSLHGCGSAVIAAQFSPGSGHNVATGATDGSVAIWSPATVSASFSSTREARLACGGQVTCVAWDARADKVMLVGTASRGILAWHADTRRVASEIPPDPTVPWVSELACSRKDPVFIVAAATAPPLGSRRTSATTITAMGGTTNTSATSYPAQRVLSAPPPPQVLPSQQLRHPAQHSPSPLQQRNSSISGGSCSSSSTSISSSGRLSLWNMRAFKRVSSYILPQNSPVLSLAFNAQGSWFAAGTCRGDVHLYDSSLSLTRQQPLSSFRANSASAGTAMPPLSAPAAVQVYDSAAETILVTCCGATVRLWSLRRLAEPMLSVPLLPYLPYGGGAGGGWSLDWAPCMCLSPRGAAAAVVLGGGGPAVYVVDLQGNSSDDLAAGSGSTSWLSGVFGSPTTAPLTTSTSAAALNRMAAAAAGRVSVIFPYSGVGQSSDSGVGRVLSDVTGGMSYDLDGDEDGVVYGTSCTWHPTRDLVVVGYSDGAVQTVALTRTVSGGSAAGGLPSASGA